jgi:hypothetical protein
MTVIWTYIGSDKAYGTFCNFFWATGMEHLQREYQEICLLFHLYQRKFESGLLTPYEVSVYQEGWVAGAVALQCLRAWT